MFVVSAATAEDMDVDADDPVISKEAARLQAKLAALGEGAAADNTLAERRVSHAAASTSGGGDHSRQNGAVTSLTMEAVRETVAAFYSRVPTGQCANCGAFAPVIKRCCALRLPAIPCRNPWRHG